MRFVLIFTLFCLFLLGFSSTGSAVGIQSSIYTSVYSYQFVNATNSGSEDHLWLFSGIRSQLSDLPLQSSFNTHFQYRGNHADQFSESGDFHLYSAYWQYGQWGSDTEFKIGRFFLYRGVGLGNIDGLEYTTDLSKYLGITVFGGIVSPDNHRFEISKGHSPIYGGEFRYSKLELHPFQRFMLKLSYADQYREGNEFRNNLGLQLFGRINAHWTILSNTQYRLLSQDIRTSSLRIRYASSKIIWFSDIGIYRPEISSSSWFRNFKLPKTTEIDAPIGIAVFPFSTRMQTIFDYYFVPAKWGFRTEATSYYSGNEGHRVGVACLTPYGQIGYQHSFGYLSKSNGPWISLYYEAFKQIHWYLRASSIQSEWEEVGIQTQTTRNFISGVRYTPNRFKFLTGELEYQYYSNPKLKRDGRVLGTLTYTFSQGITR
ncbi:MAG: hypothetical protein N2450_02710 [bacterium]|nr:hypothetical protein [bacterium]